MKNTILQIITLIALVIGIQGCQFLDSNLSPSEEILLETAVKAGTLEFIKDNPERADRVASVVTSAKKSLEDGEVDLVELREIVENNLEIEDLTPTESLLLSQLIALIAEQINTEILNENRMVKLTQILTWVDEVVAPFVEKTT